MAENRCKVSLEDLVRLKRAERPDPEFWEKFERELLIKQRLLLQKQSSEGAIFTAHFWANAKRTCAYGTAVASGGAFLFAGFIGIQSLVISDADNSSTLAPIPTFAVTPISTEDLLPPIEQTIKSPAKDNLTQTASLASNTHPASTNTVLTHPKEYTEAKSLHSLDSLEIHAEALTLAISKPFEDLNIEEAINFNKLQANNSPLHQELKDKYLEPVGYANSSSSQFASTPNSMQRIRVSRMEDQLYSSTAASGLNLNEITLRF